MAELHPYESPYKSVAQLDNRSNINSSLSKRQRGINIGSRNFHSKSISHMSENKHDRSNSSISQHSLGENSFISHIKQKSDFGIEGYHAPNNDGYLEKVKTMKWIKDSKKLGFLDYTVKIKKEVPASNSYIGCSDWKKELDCMLYGGSPMKGKFLKGKRKTIEGEILENKKETNPGPGTYNPKLLEGRKGLYKSTVEKGQFIEHYKAVGLDTPGSIYKPNVEKIKPRIGSTKIYPMTKAEKEKYVKRKSELPDPGTYNIDKPILKVKDRILVAHFSKKPKATFIDQAKKDKAFLPGVGHYKGSDDAYKRISSLPVSIRSKRH